jgi:hypothetical protein
MKSHETIVDNLCTLRLKIGRLKTNSRITIADSQRSIELKLELRKTLLIAEAEFESLLDSLHFDDLPEMHRRMRNFAYSLGTPCIEKLFSIVLNDPIIARVKKYYKHINTSNAKLILIQTYCRWRGRKNHHNKQAFETLCANAHVDPEVWNIP